MCISAEVSFGAAAALIPAGGYCVWAAARKAPRYAILGATPALFALQQAAEGAVWVGLARGDPDLVARAAQAFLAIALGLWPTWFTIAALAIETRPRLLRLLGLWAALAAGWFWLWCWPVLLAPPLPGEVYVVRHSIRYEYVDRAGFGPRAAYVLASAVPLLVVADRRRFVVPVALGALSALAAIWIFDHAFASVWCFFAAVNSAYLVWIFARLPGSPRTPQAGEPSAAVDSRRG
jgi:hypothetical protein